MLKKPLLASEGGSDGSIKYLLSEINFPWVFETGRRFQRQAPRLAEISTLEVGLAEPDSIRLRYRVQILLASASLS